MTQMGACPSAPTNQLSKDKRFIIYRLRLCPACGKHAARVQKTDSERKPVLWCSTCKRFFPAEYAD